MPVIGGSMPRIAVLDKHKCQPKRCSLECHRYCPGVRIGDETIVIDERTGKPIISETLCSGCGICVHKCPFHAITIVNLPQELEGRCIHRYGTNGFALYELAIPREGAVTGLVGQNGVGKTTALNILFGKLKPNLGKDAPASPDELNDFFKGSELQGYFKRLDELRLSFKPQPIEQIPTIVRGSVSELLERVDERRVKDELVQKLGLQDVMDREIKNLSGGELQRLAIAAASARDADVYFFDEPSSHLDVYQRLNAANVIRSLAELGRAVLVVEHDLAVLDYICDYVHIIYGIPGAYGVISNLRSVRVGINTYLEGYLREENVRFRDESIHFEVKPSFRSISFTKIAFNYPQLIKRFSGFELSADPGSIFKGEVVGVIGQNATGKTTFIKMLAGEVEPDSGKIDLNLALSYKPQYLRMNFEGSALEWLRSQVGEFNQAFELEIVEPLEIKPLLDREVSTLSGGEMQRLAIAACLGRRADLYLLDEPSAYLDVEQRLYIAKLIRRVIEGREATAFVVDHDLLFIDSISDRLIFFGGKPGVRGRAFSPTEMRQGMNMFLREVGVTFRRDPQTGRPRANKLGSRLDREQKEKGEFFYVG
jgi:ATP-binding cassette subfamily E protein 1